MRVFFFFLLFCVSFFVFAESLEVSLAPASVEDGASVSADAVNEILLNSLEGRGFSVTDGASLVMESYVWKRGLRIFVAVRLYDDGGKRLVGSSLVSVTSAIELSSAVDAAVVAVMDALSSKAPEYSPEADKVFPLIVYSEDEGASVFMGDEELGVVKDGVLESDDEVFVSQGSRLRLRVEKDGYFPAVVDYVADSSPAEVRLPPLVKKTVFESGVFLTSGQVMGLGLEGRWNPMPGYVFLALREYFFVQYAEGLFSSYVLPHNQLEFAVGAYFFGKPGDFFRIWIESGAGFFASFMRDSSVPLDFYLHVGAVGFEFNVFRAVGLFLRGGYDYSFGTGIIPEGAIGLEPDGGPLFSVGGMIRW